jgi:hypothetical protein
VVEFVKKKRPSIETWQVELLRLTAFPAAYEISQPKPWWRQVVGESPENTKFQSRIQKWDEDGQFGNGSLLLQYNLQRIDWVWTARTPDVDLNPVKTLPALGSFLESLYTFKEKLAVWFSLDIPNLYRLAFGGILVRPVDNHEEGYEELSAYIPLELDKDSADFFYQINRPRYSKTESGLSINRLSKWSVAKVQNVSLNLSQAGVSPAIADTKYFCRLEIDINNIPEAGKALPKDRLASIFDELINLGKEIATNGDVK